MKHSDMHLIDMVSLFEEQLNGQGYDSIEK